MPTFEDCLHFIHHKKCNIHRDAVISIADEKALQKGENFITLSEELYEQFLSELHDIADLLPEGESCDSDDEGRTQNAEPYSMEYPMEYLKWSTPKSHVLVK